MEKSAPEKNELVKLIGPESYQELHQAQRLAAIDPDVRLALSSTWWVAVRLGMKLGSDAAVPYPPDPFGARQMQFRSETSWTQ
jgi:hypothetical protein